MFSKFGLRKHIIYAIQIFKKNNILLKFYVYGKYSATKMKRSLVLNIFFSKTTFFKENISKCFFILQKYQKSYV